MIAKMVLIFIVTQRILELFWSRRNTQKLIQKGGKEYFSEHYKWIVTFHVCWLTFLFLSIPPNPKADPIMLIIFVGLEFCRFWVLRTLGSRWTTKIIKIPNEKPITTGPYRFVRHPNYIIVVGEVLIVPLIFGLWEFALLGSTMHAIIIAHRIKKEDLAWQQNA